MPLSSSQVGNYRPNLPIRRDLSVGNLRSVQGPCRNSSISEDISTVTNDSLSGSSFQRESNAARSSNATTPGLDVVGKNQLGAAKSVTAPNASTEEVELTMRAFARELILELGGQRASQGAEQLNTLLSTTEPNSGTQRYLRQFMSALHLLNVPGMYDKSDPTHMEKRHALANAFIDAVEEAAKLHKTKPGGADEVWGARLDLNTSTGARSYKCVTKMWRALGDALKYRSNDATDMEHMQAYYDRHVVPRTQLRAQFVYGETTDNPEARLHTGSKQTVWNAARWLVCLNISNPEEKGLSLGHACNLLHSMPEYLRRPENKPDSSTENKDRSLPGDATNSRDNAGDASPQASSSDGNLNGVGAGSRVHPEQWHVNLHMTGPTIHWNQNVTPGQTYGRSFPERSDAGDNVAPSAANRQDRQDVEDMQSNRNTLRARHTQNTPPTDTYDGHFSTFDDDEGLTRGTGYLPNMENTQSPRNTLHGHRTQSTPPSEDGSEPADDRPNRRDSVMESDRNGDTQTASMPEGIACSTNGIQETPGALGRVPGPTFLGLERSDSIENRDIDGPFQTRPLNESQIGAGTPNSPVASRSSSSMSSSGSSGFQAPLTTTVSSPVTAHDDGIQRQRSSRFDISISTPPILSGGVGHRSPAETQKAWREMVARFGRDG